MHLLKEILNKSETYRFMSVRRDIKLSKTFDVIRINYNKCDLIANLSINLLFYFCHYDTH